MVTQDEDNEKLANLLESYHIDNDDLTLSDPEEEEDIQMGGMVMTPEDTIQVHAHVEYKNRFIKFSHQAKNSYAICDSGADSCVVGRMAKVISTTMRTANLVGYGQALSNVV